MKKITYLLIFFLFSNALFSQCPPGNVTLNNQAQVDYFLEAYPNCTQIVGNVVLDSNATGPIRNLNGLQNITTILGGFFVDYNIWMSNLSGLESLQYVGGNFSVVDSWFTDMSALQNLTHVGGNLTMTGNNVVDFSPLNNITFFGGDVVLSNTTGFSLNVNSIPGDFKIGLRNTVPNLNGLSSLTSVGGDLQISAVAITDLSGLQLQTVGGEFRISDCSSLLNLNGAQSLTSVGSINVYFNNSLLTLNGLEQITALNGGLYVQQNNALNSLSGLDNLTSINGWLYIESNDNLLTIEGISNIDPMGITDLYIRNNGNLSLCQELNICNYLFNGGTHDIHSNAEGCSDFDDLIFSCNTRWKNTIKGNVSIDIGSNGCSSNNIPMGNVQFKATSGGNTYTTFTDANGDYLLFVPEGFYNTELATNLDYYSPDPVNYNISFSGVGNEEIVDFCVTPTQIIDDVKITILPSLNDPRPGFDTRYKIVYENIGTTVMNGSIDFNYDDSMLSFLNSNIATTAQSNGFLSWDYTNLYPFEKRSIIARFNVFPPPTVNIGDIVNIQGLINPITGDNSPENNTVELNQLVIGSYDPNDKQVLEGETILIDNIGDDLNYLIRFQNTGTASAINVKVVDTLETTLDWSTFKIVDLSHPGRVQINDNIVEFIFDDIYLPDSTTDEPNSHGYAAFSIKPKSNVGIGTIIENQASIYFDFNEPIITNRVATYVDADSDNDTVLDSIDNCIYDANTDQSDVDFDGIGDVCDDDIEVNPPYAIGFDTDILDPLWRSDEEHNSYTEFSISDLYDVNGDGKTVKLYSRYSSYNVMLISPRLNNLSSDSVISFWSAEPDNSIYGVELGFMTDPDNPSTFTRLRYHGPPTTMTQYTLDMANYEESMGNNFAILVKGNTVYIDDFVYDTTLSLSDSQERLFKLYPNPVNDFLQIESKSPFDSATIFDVNGRTLKTLEFSANNATIDMSNLSRGLYFIEVQSGASKQTQKFLKK